MTWGGGSTLKDLGPEGNFGGGLPALLGGFWGFLPRSLAVAACATDLRFREIDATGSPAQADGVTCRREDTLPIWQRNEDHKLRCMQHCGKSECKGRKREGAKRVKTWLPTRTLGRIPGWNSVPNCEFRN